MKSTLPTGFSHALGLLKEIETASGMTVYEVELTSDFYSIVQIKRLVLAKDVPAVSDSQENSVLPDPPVASAQFVSDLDAETQMAIYGVAGYRDKKKQACKKVIEMFKDDSQKILAVFARYWQVCPAFSDEDKAAFLRQEMLQAFPDFLTNDKKSQHVLELMTALMEVEKQIILAPANRGCLHAYRVFTDVKLEDMFAVWTASDTHARLKSILDSTSARHRYQV